MKIFAGRLKEPFDIICNVLDDVVITFLPDRMFVSEADKMAVNFIDYSLKASAFEEYGIQDKLVVRLPTEELSNVLKRFDIEDVITLESVDSGGKFKIYNSRKSFTLGCLQLDQEATQYNLEKIYSLLNVNISIKSDELKEVLDDIHAIVREKTEFIPVIVEKSDKLYFKYKTYESGIDMIEKVSKATSVFNILHFDKFAKKKLSDVVEIKLGEDAPILFTINQSITKKVGEQDVKEDIATLKVLVTSMMRDAVEEN
jgi:hypothetical protein